VEKSRSSSPWSHVVSFIFAQFTHAVGLTDVFDSLRLHSEPTLNQQDDQMIRKIYSRLLS